jgi:hypothetical protein
MATYQFETITAAQALAIMPSDTLLVSGAAELGPNAVVVLAAEAGQAERVELTFGGRTVTFNANIEALSLDGRLIHGGSQGAGPAIVIGTAQSDGIAVNVPVAAIYGGGGDDALAGETAARFFGGSGADTLQGGGDGQLFVAGEGDDFILPAGDADTVDGGAGTDTVALGGRRADFLIVHQGDGLAVYSKLEEAAAPTTLRNVERLRFSDGDFSAVDLQPAPQIPTLTPQPIIGLTGETLDMTRQGDPDVLFATIWQMASPDIVQALTEPVSFVNLLAGMPMSSLTGGWIFGA